MKQSKLKQLDCFALRIKAITLLHEADLRECFTQTFKNGTPHLKVCTVVIDYSQGSVLPFTRHDQVVEDGKRWFSLVSYAMQRFGLND